MKVCIRELGSSGDLSKDVEMPEAPRRGDHLSIGPDSYLIEIVSWMLDEDCLLLSVRKV